jgi:predicted MFS family arabinose efflux permease
MPSSSKPAWAPAPARSAGYRAVFAVSEFRAVFVAHLLSMLGTVLCEIALSILVYRLTGSPLLSALTFALGLLPYAVGGTALSSVADRFPARRVLVCCDLLCAIAAAGLSIPGTPVAALLVLRCVIAAIAPVFAGTRAATLTDTLGEGDVYVLGRSVLRLVSQSAQLAGFAAGGLLLVVVSPRTVLAVTTATFLASAVLLRWGTRARPARAATGAVLASSLRGMRRLVRDRRIRALLLLAWVPPMFVVVSEALMTPYAVGLGVGPAGVGLLMCGMPIGAVVSETLAGSLLGPRGRVRLTRPVALWACLPALAYAFHPSLGFALICQVLTGFGIAYSLGLDQRFIAAIPEELRGAAMTLQTAGLMTAQGLGMALAGVAAEVLSVPKTIATGGAIGVLAVSATLWYLRATRRATSAAPLTDQVPAAG